MSRGKTFVYALALVLVGLAGDPKNACAGDRIEMGFERETEARSSTSGRESAATGEPSPTWYGWQTMLVDAATGGLLIAAQAGRNDQLASLSLVAYLVGGPTVHAAHKHGTSAGVSFGLRLGLPVLGYLIGSAKDDCGPTEEGCGVGAGFGAALGLAVAAPIDWFGLSWEAGKAPSGARVAPSVAWQKHGATLGVTGTF